MNKKLYLTPITIFLSLVYLLLLYLIFDFYCVVDFTPFYISAKSLIYGLNPYPMSINFPANLNPPFFLCLFYPLGLLNYHAALIIATFLSLIVGLIGAKTAFFYAFSDEFRKKCNLVLYLLYFSFFPILMDLSIVQVGSLLFFFLMVGYHFYLQKNDNLAGIFWGIIIAIKLFPGLLFFFVLKQGRYRVFLVALATTLLAMLIPLLIFGPTIYKQYFTMISAVYWYGDSWNASIYGFIFRLLMDLKHPGQQNMFPITSFYLVLFLVLLLCYLLAMGPKEIDSRTKQINHQPFCLTLTMMILMSPFGWLYYFSLLIFPLLLTGLAYFQEETKTLIPKLAWVVCFCLLNFPIAYVIGSEMQNFNFKIAFYSFYFYGLVLLNILIICRRKLAGKSELNITEIKHDEKISQLVATLLISLAFGLIVPLNSFLFRVSMGNPGNYKNADLDKLLKAERMMPKQ